MSLFHQVMYYSSLGAKASLESKCEILERENKMLKDEVYSLKRRLRDLEDKLSNQSNKDNN